LKAAALDLEVKNEASYQLLVEGPPSSTGHPVNRPLEIIVLSFNYIIFSTEIRDINRLD
jgi:hypothetical protein